MNSLKHSQSYYRAACRLLPNTEKNKNAILSRLKSELDAYAQEHPNAVYSDFITRFGTPEAMAAACVENMDTMAVLKGLRTHQRIWNAVVATVLVILISWGSVYFWNFIEFRNDTIYGEIYESPAHNEIDNYSWEG